MFAVCVLTNGH